MHRKFIMTVATIFALGAVTWGNASASAFPPLQTVERVDLSRYIGRWYEIARLPNRFQKGCSGNIADYSFRVDGEINVINSCRNEKDGTSRQAKGRAWVVDPVSNARLKVSFFWPFRGDYWIIELGKAYEYAVVGTPDRKYLWILSRTAAMNDDVYAAIMQRVKQQEFDPTKVLKDIPATRKSGQL